MPRIRLITAFCFVMFLACCVVLGQRTSVLTPGTPPAGVSYSTTLVTGVTRLRTIVTAGDVVLLKKGTSTARSNWAAFVRFTNQPYLESSVGYATLYQDETTGFAALVPSTNAVYVKASSPTTYRAGGATYTIPVTLP